MSDQPVGFIKQEDLTPSTLHRMLVGAGFSVELKADGTLILMEPGWPVVITVAVGEVNKIFYSSGATFRSGVSLSDKLELTNRINQNLIGATYVEGDDLRSAGWLTFEQGILTSTVVKTLVDFRVLFEDALASSEEGLFI